MKVRPIHVVLDADDADTLRDFWIDALGYEQSDLVLARAGSP